MFIDTHCHLSQDDYDDIDLVVSDNQKNNISKMIISGCDKLSILESIRFSAQYSDIYLTLGYHPSCCSEISDKDLQYLEKVLLSTPKVVGIGEIGLDYHYGSDNRERQVWLFDAQLQLAERLRLPVVIHSRDATMDTIRILSKYSVRGVIHCFSGSIETANTYIKMGFYLGIGGVVTFKNSKLYQVIEKIGLDHIVLETDSPYLTPEPYRGSKNSSKYIPIIAEKLATICHVDSLVVAQVTTENAIRLFDLK